MADGGTNHVPLSGSAPAVLLPPHLLASSGKRSSSNSSAAAGDWWNQMRALATSTLNALCGRDQHANQHGQSQRRVSSASTSSSVVQLATSEESAVATTAAPDPKAPPPFAAASRARAELIAAAYSRSDGRTLDETSGKACVLHQKNISSSFCCCCFCRFCSTSSG